MLTCRQITEFLMEYLDGGLPVAQRVRFELHLALCAACRRYLTSYSETAKAGKAAFDDADAPPVPEELVQAILASRKP